MADLTWYDQKIPPELYRTEVKDFVKIWGGITLLFTTVFAVIAAVGIFVFHARIDSFVLGFIVVLPVALTVIGILVRPRRKRNVGRVGVSGTGVLLRYEDGEALSLPWDSISLVQPMKKEEYYEVIDVCNLAFTREDGRRDSVLLFWDPGTVIRREVLRREFRKGEGPSEPVDRPGFSASDYATPPWAVDGLTASYVVDQDRFWFRIALRGKEAAVETRTDWNKESLEEQKEHYDDSDPLDRELWEENLREWKRTPLPRWQAGEYGRFFINPRKDRDEQSAGGSPLRFVERGTLPFRGRRRGALRFDASVEEACFCVRADYFHALGRRARPGTCPLCGGGWLRRFGCTWCHGTGRHDYCEGTGRDRYENRYWYEERTGILLRQEHWKEKELEESRALDSLEPDIMPEA